MHGDDCYETRQVFLFHVFVCVFCLDGAQNTTFFKKTTNEIFGLNFAQLICEPMRSENKRLCTITVNSTSNATNFFLLLEICPGLTLIRCTRISISVTKCPLALLANFNITCVSEYRQFMSQSVPEMLLFK